jgi:carbon-monoxide dehydrogenase medium subunit
MPAKPDTYHRPRSLNEALRLLSQPDTVPLAGGTTLLASEAGLDVAAVVDLQDLGLDRIEPSAYRLVAGAMVRLAGLHQALAAAPADGPGALLREAIHRAGPNTYRHAATVGGTVAARLADSEWLATLLVLDATLALEEGDSETMSVEAYLAAAERPRGLITAVHIPTGAGRGQCERVARTPADYPIVAITGWRPAEGAVRLAGTGLGPRPKRLSAAEAAVRGGLDERAIGLAAVAAADANAHPGDFRGSGAYRADMAAVLTRRVLSALI